MKEIFILTARLEAVESVYNDDNVYLADGEIKEAYATYESAREAYHKYLKQIYDTIGKTKFLDTSCLKHVSFEDMFDNYMPEDFFEYMNDYAIYWYAGEWNLDLGFTFQMFTKVPEGKKAPILPYVDIKKVKINGLPKEDFLTKLLDEQKEKNRALGVCQHCGGKFKGLITKKCSKCKKKKDY